MRRKVLVSGFVLVASALLVGTFRYGSGVPGHRAGTAMARSGPSVIATIRVGSWGYWAAGAAVNPGINQQQTLQAGGKPGRGKADLAFGRQAMTPQFPDWR